MWSHHAGAYICSSLGRCSWSWKIERQELGRGAEGSGLPPFTLSSFMPVIKTQRGNNVSRANSDKWRSGLLSTTLLHCLEATLLAGVKLLNSPSVYLYYDEETPIYCVSPT